MSVHFSRDFAFLDVLEFAFANLLVAAMTVFQFRQ